MSLTARRPVPKDKAVTKDELRAEIAERRNIGAQMAHLCYNLSQQSKNPNAKLMADLYQLWDAIKRREPNVNLAAERRVQAPGEREGGDGN